MKPLRTFAPEKVPNPDTELVKKIQRALIDHQGPYYVEIGCGVGLHPIRFCQDNPDTLLLAIERTKDKFRSFEGRIKSHQLPNLLPAHAEASLLLPHCLRPRSVDGFFILYPNPYPKESQKNLRWAHSPFLNFVMNVLKPGGEILFATNLEFYKEELLRRLHEFPGSTDVASVTQSEQPLSHFEKKYLNRGETCWHLRFQASSET